MFVRNLIILLFVFCASSTAMAQQTGHFSIEVTPSQLLGEAAAVHSDHIDPNAKLSWEIYIPKNHDPDKQAGVVVFAGSRSNIKIPNGWRSVMEDKNLIWIASKNSDHANSVHQKMLTAMMSVPLITSAFNVDENRVYVTGEGKTAARAILRFPDVFSGALLVGDYIWFEDAEERINGVLDKRFVFSGNSPIWAVYGGTHIYTGVRENTGAYKNFKQAGVEGAVKLRRGQDLRRRNFARIVDYLDGQNMPKRYIESY